MTVACRRNLPKRGPHPRIGSHVERRERVVEQVDGGTSDDRTRDGQSLSLSAGEVDAALGDPHGQSVFVGPHEIVGGGHLSASHMSSSVASALP